MTQYSVAVPPERIANAILEVFRRNGLKFAIVHPWPFLEAAFRSDLDLAVASEPTAALQGALRELSASEDLRIVQCLRYEIVSGYYIIVATREHVPRFLHFDCLFDPLGVNRYRFRTTFLAASPEHADGFAIVARAPLAAYITVKRAVKASLDDLQWRTLREHLEGHVEIVADILQSELRFRADDLLPKLIEAKSLDDARAALAEIERRFKRAKWLRLPVRTLWGRLLTARRQMARLLRPTGLFVVLVGPDGSGKSTIGAQIPRLCARAFRRTLRFHWRPGFLPPLRRPRHAGAGGAPPADSADRNRLLSIARFFYYSADFLLGYWLRLAPLRARTTLIIGERYFADILVHPQRYGFNVPRWILRAVSSVIPRPDLTILLTNDAAKIHARKPELSVVQIETQLTHYRNELPRWGKHVSISTEGSAEDVAAEVSTTILRQLSDRTMARCAQTP